MEVETYTVASNHETYQVESSSSSHVLFCGESQTTAGHRLGPKVYEFYLMHLVLSGKGSFILDGVPYELAAGQTFLIQPGQLISYESDCSEPWRYRWVAFKGTGALRLVELGGFLPIDKQVAALKDFRKASALYRAIYQALRKGDTVASLQASGYLQLLMAIYGASASQDRRRESSRDDRQDEQLYQKAAHYLSSQYTHPVSIEGMAESLGYNRAYLSRIFKKKTGLSPVSFLLRLRLDRAKLLLREKPELTVEQIAASVGIQDALYFSKQFRKQHGQSPTAYRKQRLEDSSKT
ncbi:helix-turn-helix domain-containing protein [Paenibacillus sp. GCM10027627]|uniref:helix-turn-helix domain-containing protein n=1 Tax=unclassified Paenibacillus TaxID=185978 RepID=UPI0036392460